MGEIARPDRPNPPIEPGSMNETPDNASGRQQPAPAPPAPPAAGGDAAVRQQLAALAARDAELRRHEEDIRAHRRRLDTPAPGAGVSTDSIEARLAEVEQRRRQLDRFEQVLSEQQARLAEQRATIEETLRTLARQEDADANRRAETRRRLTRKIEVIRQRKNEFVEKVRAARAELRQQRDETDRKAAALRDAESAFEQRRQAFEHRAAELEVQSREIEARTRALATQRSQLERTLADTEARSRRLDARAAELEELGRRLEQQQRDLQAEREALDTRAGQLDRQRAELEQATRELEQQRAALDARREELEQFEADLEPAMRDLDQRRAQLAPAEEQLARRTEALDQRQAELDALRELIEDNARQTRDKEAALAAREKHLAAQTEELAAERERLTRQHASLLEQQIDLTAKLEDVATTGTQLSRQRIQLLEHTAELNRRAKKLKQQLAAADTRERELAALDETLQARQHEVENRTAALEARAADLAAQQDKLDQTRREQDQARTEIQARRAELQRSEVELAQARSELDNRRQELDALGRSLAEQRATLNQRADDLDTRDRQLAEQFERLDARLQSAAERERDIEQQAAEVERLRTATEEHLRQAEESERLAAEARERAEAHEVQLRQAELQAEIERENLQKQTALLEEQRQRLLEAEDQAEGRPVPAIGESVAPRPAAPTTPAAAPHARLWLLALATTFALAVGAVWYYAHPPRYRATIDLRIDGTRAEPAALVQQHAAWLLSEPLERWWEPPPPPRAWRDARQAGRLALTPLPERGSLRLTLRGADRIAAESLLVAAARAYAACVDAMEPERFADERIEAWRRQVAVLRAEQQRHTTRIAELEQHMAALPGGAQRQQAQQLFEATLRELRDLENQQRTQRRRLVALQGQAVPRGVVPPEVLQKALADDPVHAEDIKEFTAEARDYRTAIAVAMVMLDDPLQELRKAVRALGDTIREQRDLQPPAKVRAVLEQCLSDANDFDELLAGFAQDWSTRREKIERMDAERQIVKLVQQRNQATEAANRLVAETHRFVKKLRSRIDKLAGAGQATTRALVVASVLRGEMAPLKERVAGIEEGAKSLDPEVNVELDAHDRQVRGLRTRLRERAGHIRDTLQAQADRAARQAHDAEIAAARQRLTELENRRRTLMNSLLTNVTTLRQLDQRHERLRALAAALDTERTAATRLAERLHELEASPPQPQCDSIQTGPVRVTMIAGTRRLRDSTFAGGGALAVALLLCAPALIRRPVHTTPPDQPADAPETPADSETTETDE